MPKPAKNERLSRKPGRTWKILRAVAKATPGDAAQLRLRIGELEQLIVGAEEREVRRRAAGILPAETEPSVAKNPPLRYAEQKALEKQRLKGWLGIALLGLVVVLASAWFFFRLLVVL